MTYAADVLRVIHSESQSVAEVLNQDPDAEFYHDGDDLVNNLFSRKDGLLVKQWIHPHSTHVRLESSGRLTVTSIVGDELQIEHAQLSARETHLLFARF